MAKSKKEDSEAKVANESTEVQYDYIVSGRFKDKSDSTKVYEVGQSVNRFGEDRLNDLVKRGLVERRIKE
ncbi:hypothetical protein FVR03_01325 [Pontibacter qinzhouensis]|uniref:Uncharacterized protein n=1 Tax=Pontibacter qinzhouensis TaxID=2603253 RepID=A0A5C8KFB3_9BACT|nr:hypothetical protein [Pontibacter qinzhouensis]TXK52385.1 hypothetical protein FVR03_01325 [Pontibacter qinzhouensis]